MSKKPVAITANDIAPRQGSSYPAPFVHLVAGRSKRVLGDQFDLTQFGVNLTTLEPGAASALRHWHMHEDEFIYVLEGEPMLVNNEGEHQLGPGMCAGFKAGDANGHQIVNKSSRQVVYLEIGTRSPVEQVDYPDVDLKAEKLDGKYVMTRKDGSSY